MSLIQQALEKTSRGQETTTANSAPRTYDRDPMGAALEQELTQVQQSYAQRRKFLWKISWAVLGVCFVAGLSYVGIRSRHPEMKAAPGAVSVAPHAPVRIFSGTIYRLTGITNINGKSMAVINEEIVAVGDSLSGKAVVRAIGNGSVRLDVQGKEISLIL